MSEDRPFAKPNLRLCRRRDRLRSGWTFDRDDSVLVDHHLEATEVQDDGKPIESLQLSLQPLPGGQLHRNVGSGSKAVEKKSVLNVNTRFRHSLLQFPSPPGIS